MISRKWVRAVAAKEFRALLPVWGSCVGLAGLLSLPNSTLDSLHLPRVIWELLLAAVPFVFVLTPLVLGALSTGHEFALGTWPGLLAQPVTRSRVLAVKYGVLVVLVASAGAVSFAAYARLSGKFDPPLLIILGPLVAGLVLAPWFALLARSAVAGTTLAAAVPTALYVISALAVLAIDGRPISRADQIATTERLWDIWQVGMVLVAVIGAWCLHRSFVHAEVRERGGGGVSEWRLRSRPLAISTRSRHRSPVRHLIAKDLRLQIPTALLAVLFAGIWIVTLTVPHRDAAVFPGFAGLYAVVVALLSGSLASAEERQMDTITGQALLPVAARWQWLIKVAVVSIVVAGLTVGLIAALVAAGPGDVRAHFVRLNFSRTFGPFSCVLMGSISVGLYVSTLSRAGLRAVIASGVVAVSLMALAQQTDMGLTAVLMRVSGSSWAAARSGFVYPSGLRSMHMTLTLFAICAVCLMALRFAYQNHRYLDRNVRRIVTQVAWMYGTYVGLMAAIVYLTRIR